MMEFEIFVGANGRKFYVYPVGKWPEVQKAVADLTHQKPERFKCITVWIIRGVEERDGFYDYLYLTKTPGTEKMLAAVRV